MKRLYYDCPIEAAYMAKNFGVKFADKEGQFVWPTDTFPANWAIHDSFIGRATGYNNKAFFIRPDSLSIFEPQEGDIAMMGDDAGYLRWGLKTDGTGWYISFPDGSAGGDGEYIEIIKRNNKPFLTPLTEE